MLLAFDATIRKQLDERNKILEEKKKMRIINERNVKRIVSSISEIEMFTQIKEITTWLKKVSNYVPISNDDDLEELLKHMVSLSKVRTRLNFLYDKPGLDLMTRVRECMIRYLVVQSELRAHRKEYLFHWFSDEYWMLEWSRVILDLSVTDTMEKYGFPDLYVHDFLFLLTLELVCADSASKLENPMILKQPIEDKPTNFILIPTEAAAKKYQIQVSRILNHETTLTKWVYTTLTAYNLP
jgi:hypothetical protein